VKEHLRTIQRKYHSAIRHAIETQLQFEPGVETYNRKPLRRPPDHGTPWEIRFGPDNRFRVFYVVAQKERQVLIFAIGTKRGNRLVIGGEEVVL
jgi:mRNA-degrading endonuclease RelE of RelBE toxin-antitoxin system